MIGNGAYQRIQRLNNPAHDAADVGNALRNLGFDVTSRIDADLRTLRTVMDDFAQTMQGADTALFYYSGHGVAYNGENYLVPVNADVQVADDIQYEGVPLQRLLSRMNASGALANVIILDACRNNPFPANARSMERGLAVVGNKPPESMIIYATEDGQTAEDGAGRNGTFTAALLKHISRSESLTDIMFSVKGDVRTATNQKQKPANYDNLSRPIFLRSAASASTATSAPSAAPAAAKAPSFGAVVAATGNLTIKLASPGTVSVAGLSAAVPAGTVPVNDLPAGAQTVSVRYADGKTESASVTIPAGGTANLSFTYTPPAPQPVPAVVVAVPVERSPGESLRGEIHVQGGSYQMGSDSGDWDEKPVHAVRVSDFWMMKTEVTQKDYAALMGTNPSNFKGDTLPVESVSWYDAVAYANRLSQKDGLRPAYTINGTTWNGTRTPPDGACR